MVYKLGNDLNKGIKGDSQSQGIWYYSAPTGSASCQPPVSGEEEIVVGHMREECESSPQPRPNSSAWQAKPPLPLGNHLRSPNWGWPGGAGASSIPLSPLKLLRACGCCSRDANMHSATRFLLSSHYFVVFIDLLGKNLCTSLLHCQDSLWWCGGW